MQRRSPTSAAKAALLPFLALGLVTALLWALPQSAHAAPVQGASSLLKVSFHIEHPGKQYDAHLNTGGGKAQLMLDPQAIEKTALRVGIHVVEFNSSNESRDSHMMEAIEGLIFPQIKWQVRGVSGASGPIRPGEYQVTAKGPLTIKDTTLDIEAPVHVLIDEEGVITVTSEFEISLDAFGVERPTLLFIPITDIVPITVRIVFPIGKSLFGEGGE